MKIRTKNQTFELPVAMVFFALMAFSFWWMTAAASQKINEDVAKVSQEVAIIKDERAKDLIEIQNSKIELEVARQERTTALAELADAKIELSQAKAETKKILAGRHQWMEDLIDWISSGIEDRFTFSMFAAWEERLFNRNQNLNRPEMIPRKITKRKLPKVPK